MLEELPSVFLVGPMGAGKTTIGRLLAKQLGRTFVDSDWYVESQTGADIAWIFAKEELLIFVTPKLINDGVSRLD